MRRESGETVDAVELLETNGEIAALLKVSVATIKRWRARRGRRPPLPVLREGEGGRVLAVKKEVLRWYREDLLIAH